MTIHLPAESALALAVALTDVRFDLTAKRSAAEQAIEDLIQFLDDTEGDCDLEASQGYDTEGDVLDDGEAVDEDGGNIDDEPHDWDELEDNLGSGAMQLRDGTIINDREATDCGFMVCDDHGIGDADGAIEAGFGRIYGGIL